MIRILVLATLLVAGASAQVQLHVPSQYPTLNDARDAALPGDTIVVAPGTYVAVGLQLAFVNLVGTGTSPADVVIQGNGSNSALQNLPRMLGDVWGLVENVTIEDSIGQGNNNGGAGELWAGAVVRNCIFRNCLVTGSTRRGGALWINGGWNSLVAGWTPAQVINCLFENNGAFAGGALALSAQAVVSGCTFVGNTATGGGGGAIFSFGSIGPTHPVGLIVNSTFIANETSGTNVSGGAIRSLGALEIRNGILRGNLWDGAPNEIDGTATVTYSNVEGGFPGTGNVDVDPQLIALPSGLHVLSAGSPCRDAGDPADVAGVAGLTFQDADGNWRTSDARADMGADESPATHRGSDTDVRLRAGFPGATSEAPTLAGFPGSLLAIEWESVLGTYDWAPTFLLAGTFPTGTTPPSMPGFPELHMTTTNALVLDGPGAAILPPVLAPGGETFTAIVPGGLAGLSLMLQAMLFAPNPDNPFFTTSNGVVLELN